MKQTILFTLFITIGFISCKKDFLDVGDRSTIIRQEYVVDLKTSQEFLNGIYIMLSSNFYTATNLIYPDLAADNTKPVIDGATLVQHYNWAQVPLAESTEFNMDGLWVSGYAIARSCSFLIEKVSEYRNENPAKSDNMKAEAYALRALVHFMMVNVFAQQYNFTTDASHPGIPYATTYDWTQPIARKSVKEVYSDMISDLNNAIPLFSATSNNTLLFNSLAAKALLAKVYLFKEDFAAAKNLATEVAASVPIMTNNYPEKLYTLEEEEALFQLSPEGVNYSTLFSGVYFSPNFYLQFTATSDIANILKEDPNDVRSNWVTDVAGDWYITKFPVGVEPNYPYPEGAYYQTILRSSEMYLSAAESFAKLNNEDSARYYLDAIRIRANPAATPTTVSGQSLTELIYKERQKEFAFDGLRLFDLLRWKKGINRIDAPNPDAKNLPYPNNKAIAPIPRLDVSISGIPQNPGY